MSYLKAVDKLNKKEQDKLEKIIDAWRKQKNGQIQVQNLQNEVFLDTKDMNTLLRSIVKEAKFDKDEKLLTDELLIKLKGKQLYRKGGVMKNSRLHIPQFVGTIMPQKALFNRITTNYSEKFNYNHEAFRRKLKKIGKKGIKNKYGEFIIKNKSYYSIWFTWNGENTEDTIDYIESWTENRARVELGLGQQYYDDKALIALVFNNPAYEDSKTDTLFRPTCYDSDFNLYFRPTSLPSKYSTRNKVKNHGLTFSLSKNPAFGARLGHFEGNQPEALGISGDFQLRNLHEIYFLKQGKHISTY